MRVAAIIGLGLWAAAAQGEMLEIVAGVEFQPLAAQALRVVEAMEYLGEPIQPADVKIIKDAAQSTDAKKAVADIQHALDKYCLLGVDINPESRVKVKEGEAPRRLIQQGWRNFLVKVHNEAGVTATLAVTSPNAAPLYKQSTGSAEPKEVVKPGDVPHRFLDALMYNNQPLSPTLSGLAVDYRILQLFCRDVGKREAKFGFNVGQGTQDIGFRNEASVLFDAVPATSVVLRVADHNGEPVMASFLFRDRFGRVYPSPVRRLEPDFFFHPQIYRADGESVNLPAGEYTVEYTRGPEYKILTKKITVPTSASHEESFKLQRWIEPKKLGWWSGDHHVHAAGCKHYESPTQGVTPEAMFRHILGEDLNVGCVLSWGPCWYFQKQYFEGKVSALSRKDYLMRYDVEVSGFPSSHAGHLCLLRLKEDDFPQTSRIEEWPSWDLPVLKWGKEQGGVVGYSHSGHGLHVKSLKLPNDEIPPFDGIGANEYIVDVVHGVCDFISAVDTPMPWELNIWYKTNDCGMRCKISGETDFPCIYGERIGLGRVYVKLPGALDFNEWAEGIKLGRSYVSDGLSHLIDMKVNDLELGEKESQLDLPSAGTVKVTAKVSALLAERPNLKIRLRSLAEQPYWHVERARVGDSRRVPVELIVNSQVVDRKEIVADGHLEEVSFDAPIAKSSWIALRIPASSHTNPVYVQVAGKPIRASKKSAEWCVKSVDQCWSQKKRLIRSSELATAEKAFNEARAVYQKIAGESEN